MELLDRDETDNLHRWKNYFQFKETLEDHQLQQTLMEEDMRLTSFRRSQIRGQICPRLPTATTYHLSLIHRHKRTGQQLDHDAISAQKCAG